jgi:translation initiation factor 3 subunit C
MIGLLSRLVGVVVAAAVTRDSLMMLIHLHVIEFDKLNRIVQKGAVGASAPKVYVRAIAELEDFMNDTVKDKVAAKKMNAANARSLNAIKQKVKRNNRTYEVEIEAYRKDKEGFMVEEEIVAAPRAKEPKVTLVNVAPEQDDEEGFSMVGRGGKTLSYTPESIFKHLKVIIESRGKKNTDRAEQIRIMEKLLEVAQTPYQKIKVLLALIATRFDLTTGAQSYMSNEQWKALVSPPPQCVLQQG